MHQAQHPSIQENNLYGEWRDSKTEAEKNAVLGRLLPVLVEHASRVLWMVAHTVDRAFAEELAADALMDIGRFEQRSSFSTWFHARVRYNCYTYRRNARRNRDVPIEEIVAPDTFDTFLLDEVQAKLQPDDQELFVLRVREGLTLAEIASIKKETIWSVRAHWDSIREELVDLCRS